MSANVFDAEDLCKARRELQKYNAMSREEYKNILGEEICKFCPWRDGDIDHRADGLCEGTWCDDAMDNFIEENEEYFDDDE